MDGLVAGMAVLGLVTGLSPFTLACLFVVADVPRPGRNGVAFLLGDGLALVTVMLVVALVLGGTVDQDSAPRTGVLIGQLALGVVLLVVGVRMIRMPAPDPDAEMPAALRKLQNLKPVAAFVAGAATTMYPAAAVAATDLVTSDLSRAQRLGGALVFLTLAIGLPTIPVVWLAVSQAARDRLAATRGWLLGHRNAVGGWLATLVGLSIAGKAIVALLA